MQESQLKTKTSPFFVGDGGGALGGTLFNVTNWQLLHERNEETLVDPPRNAREDIAHREFADEEGQKCKNSRKHTQPSGNDC